MDCTLRHLVCLIALLVAAGLRLAPASAQDAADPPDAGTESTAEPDADLLVRLAAVTESFASDHRTHLDIQTGRLAPERSAYFEIAVSVGSCYSFIAVGDDDLTDVDVHVYAGGVNVASDTAVDNQPVVHWCNDAFDRVSAEVRAYSGAGRYVFQVLAREGGGEVVTGPLRARLDALAGRFAEGFRPALTPRVGVLATGGQSTFELDLAGGRSYVIVAAGVDTVGDLDLILLDASDSTELDVDTRPDAEPVLRYRVRERLGGRYVLRVIMASGYGEFILGVYSD